MGDGARLLLIVILRVLRRPPRKAQVAGGFTEELHKGPWGSSGPTELLGGSRAP